MELSSSTSTFSSQLPSLNHHLIVQVVNTGDSYHLRFFLPNWRGGYKAVAVTFIAKSQLSFVNGAHLRRLIVFLRANRKRTPKDQYWDHILVCDPICFVLFLQQFSSSTHVTPLSSDATIWQRTFYASQPLNRKSYAIVISTQNEVAIAEPKFR